MEYLFLRRKRSSLTSARQKNLLFRAADKAWEDLAEWEKEGCRKVDRDIYKGILYQLEIRQVFRDPSLSLKKLSDMLETNQTYLSNVVNKYFRCNLKELINSYRVEYAKELLSADKCDFGEVSWRCGFKSRSAFYAAFKKEVGIPPLSFQLRERKAWQAEARKLKQ